MENFVYSSSDYFLLPSEDGADMSSLIEEKLNKFGACVLGAGLFRVSGVKMPDGSTLCGLGPATRVLLDESIPSGIAVQLGSHSCVKDIAFFGALCEGGLPESIGERHAIAFLGTATEEDYSGQPINSIITGCHVNSFSGGGILCKDTGYSTSASLTVSDCHIRRCGVGIYIPHFSEYHQFTNVHCAGNFCGCINNGGNNVFVNCGFSANRTGFLIDNSDGKAINNTHGSAVGCTFNHSDHNKGIGIAIYGGTVGYVFSACQVFYSRIVLENSVGITFNNCNYGRAVEIEVRGAGVNMFTDSVFLNPPKISISPDSKVKFINCFNPDGEAVGV